MSKINYKYKNPSNSKSVLTVSSRLITEFNDEEYSKGESVNNRANIYTCLIGILATIATSLGSYIIQNSKSGIALINKFLFFSFIFLLLNAIYHSIKVILVRQADTLSPDIINDIQPFTEVKALQYEIKWKMWQYNQLNNANTDKLFNLHRTQRSILISSAFILILGILFYFNAFIISIEAVWFFKLSEWVIGCLIVLFSLFSNTILEKHTFWKS